MKLSVVVLALAATTGCARRSEHAFRCPGGAEFTARYGADSVTLRLPEGSTTLPLARSASGARYANDTLEFWEHAGTARLVRRGRVLYQDCRPSR